MQRGGRLKFQLLQVEPYRSCWHLIIQFSSVAIRYRGPYPRAQPARMRWKWAGSKFGTKASSFGSDGKIKKNFHPMLHKRFGATLPTLRVLRSPRCPNPSGRRSRRKGASPKRTANSLTRLVYLLTILGADGLKRADGKAHRLNSLQEESTCRVVGYFDFRASLSKR